MAASIGGDPFVGITTGVGNKELQAGSNELVSMFLVSMMFVHGGLVCSYTKARGALARAS